MKYRYVPLLTPPKAHWADDAPMVRDLTVYEPGDEPQDTGLLDVRGVKLYRVREKIKMGFE